MKTCRIYVPADDAIHTIRAGSAIVGRPVEGEDRILVYYQDSASDNIVTYEDRLHHAAGRLEKKSPTMARAYMRREHLVDVGEIRYDEVMRHWVISDLERPEDLEAWTEGPHVEGGSLELRRRLAGLRYGDLTNSERMKFEMGRMSGSMQVEDVLSIIARRR